MKLMGSLPPTIIAVLNITPDSFSDGGEYFNLSKALERARQLYADGADYVEIGGESTAPGSRPISGAEEIGRIAPVLKAISGIVPFGVDTYKAEVAHLALEHGADFINDVSCGRGDENLLREVARSSAQLILMHSKEDAASPHVTESPREYRDVVVEVAASLLHCAKTALSFGVPESKIVLDPGMGRFLSHDSRYSFELLRRFDELVQLLTPFPTMIATSRKGFLGGDLKERDPVSQLTNLLAITKGARFVRTHHPRMMRQFIETYAKCSSCI